MRCDNCDQEKGCVRVAVKDVPAEDGGYDTVTCVPEADQELHRPYCPECIRSLGIEAHMMPDPHITVVLTDRAYGGPEEGGWWYNSGDVETTVPVTLDTVQVEYEKAKKFCDEENDCRNSDISSVNSEGKYEIQADVGPGVSYPQQTPHYC